MSSTSSPAVAPNTYQPFTKAQRIQQLNDIDKSITQLLKSAGLALKTLSAGHGAAESPISERKEAFQQASESYLVTLQKVDVMLRRNIHGLDEANIMPVNKKIKQAAPKADAAGGNVATLGKLDIGWLNSRSGRVARDMEAELWEKAKVFLEGVDIGGKDGENDRKNEVDMSS